MIKHVSQIARPSPLLALDANSALFGLCGSYGC
jgi:hypothetical protein